MNEDLAYLRDVWRDWGKYMRSGRDGFPATNLLSRIQREGEGACIREHKDYLPANGCPKNLVWVHRVYMNEMDEEMSRVMLAFFGSSKSHEVKAAALGMGKTRMYGIVSKGILLSKGFEP